MADAFKEENILENVNARYVFLIKISSCVKVERTISVLDPRNCLRLSMRFVQSLQCPLPSSMSVDKV